ncbi:MAG: hypothetical protein OEY41_09605, partial [Acidimicrobiia bacterium]|nr:hypothetical protein [Acidimicrobiia bacterium]
SATPSQQRQGHPVRRWLDHHPRSLVSMATSPAPQIRNLQHTAVEALNLSEAEAEAFRQKLARVTVEVLNDPPPSDDAFHQ